MNRGIVVALAAAVAWGSWTSAAQAGPLRDWLAQRAEQRHRQADTAGDELDDAGGASAPGSLPAGVQVERDVAYGSDPEQRLDVYRPAQASGAPIVLMVHGGGWRRGDKAMDRVVTNKVRHWVPQGMVFVSIDYRMASVDPLQEAEDVAAALAFVQAKAKSWGGDPARVVLMGHSAGAHLVALVSADASIAKRHGTLPWLGTVALDSAGYDVVKVMQSRHLRLYDRAFGTDQTLWRKASPTLVVSSATVPMLLVCSSRRADSCPQADAFAAKLHSVGSRASTLPEDLSHRQINEDLGLPGPYTDAVDGFLHGLGLH